MDNEEEKTWVVTWAHGHELHHGMTTFKKKLRCRYDETIGIIVNRHPDATVLVVEELNCAYVDRELLGEEIVGTCMDCNSTIKASEFDQHILDTGHRMMIKKQKSIIYSRKLKNNDPGGPILDREGQVWLGE